MTMLLTLTFAFALFGLAMWHMTGAWAACNERLFDTNPETPDCRLPAAGVPWTACHAAQLTPEAGWAVMAAAATLAVRPKLPELDPGLLETLPLGPPPLPTRAAGGPGLDCRAELLAYLKGHTTGDVARWRATTALMKSQGPWSIKLR